MNVPVIAYRIVAALNSRSISRIAFHSQIEVNRVGVGGGGGGHCLSCYLETTDSTNPPS